MLAFFNLKDSGWKKLLKFDWDKLYETLEDVVAKEWILSSKSLDFDTCDSSIKLFLWDELLKFSFDDTPYIKSLSLDGKDYFGILIEEKKEYVLFNELPCICCETGFVAPKKFDHSEIFAQYNHLRCSWYEKW